MTAPNFWCNGHGKSDAIDHHLAWSPGIHLQNTVLVNVVDSVNLLGEVTPGWAFASGRQSDILPVVHQLRTAAAVHLATDAIRLTLGYSRT
jgi:hypothetical protein